MRFLALLAATTILAACSDRAAEPAANAPEAMNGGMAMDSSDPWAASEARMDRDMMAAAGASVADSWTAMMIAHHQGAVDMSRIVLGLDPTPEVRALAQETVDRQSREIEELKALREGGAADPKSAEPYRAAMMQMHQGMMTAKGANASETWLAKMREHHRGAIAMSDIALREGVEGPLRAVIEKTRTDQQREIAEIDRLLGSAA